ncbi:hypothetical protein BB560_006437 [Smittium megazygosporum]|uniref:Major facilitator superfamily (MFS) profile domain-containing protein n=1 Tax=Smittium megazygosporum TaxID=133381 RepID=A0A2T9Y605_9FUNG|nr:hypothetical protein BB560_006437 [Smittium megazygosporum]
MSSSDNSQKAPGDELLSPEEKALYRKYRTSVDLRVIPIFFVAYFLAILDRNNIGTANVAGFSTELGLKKFEFNWVVSSLFYTYIVFEIPSTLLLQKIGASSWLAIITICWGICCICMTYVKSYGSAIVVRVLLGVFEGIFAGPIAAALKNINGSLKEYQYIFLVQGSITVFIGLLSKFVIADYPEKCKFITKDQLTVAQKLFEADQINVSQGSQSMKSKIKTLLNIKLWAFGAIFGIGAIAGATQAIFGPTLIKEMGYVSTRALVLSSIPSGAGFISQLCTSILLSTKKRIRISFFLFTCSIMTAVFYILLAFLKPKKIRLAFLILANFFLSPTMPLTSFWMTTNIFKQNERAVGSSMTIMIAGIGGLIGSYIYTAGEAPFYKPGHLVVFGLFIVQALINIALACYFNLQNKKAERLSQQEGPEITLINPKDPNWRYTL